LRGVKGPDNPDLLQVSAICGDLPNGCGGGSANGGADAGVRYVDMIDEVGTGTFLSICSGSLGPNLEILGDAIFEQATPVRAFRLSREPDLATLEVEVNSAPSNDWVYDGASRSVVFDEDHVPPPGSTIDVCYTARCRDAP
jgi:hypothetical protein